MSRAMPAVASLLTTWEQPPVQLSQEGAQGIRPALRLLDRRHCLEPMLPSDLPREVFCTHPNWKIILCSFFKKYIVKKKNHSFHCRRQLSWHFCKTSLKLKQQLISQRRNQNTHHSLKFLLKSTLARGEEQTWVISMAPDTATFIPGGQGHSFTPAANVCATVLMNNKNPKTTRCSFSVQFCFFFFF